MYNVQFSADMCPFLIQIEINDIKKTPQKTFFNIISIKITKETK